MGNDSMRTRIKQYTLLVAFWFYITAATALPETSFELEFFQYDIPLKNNAVLDVDALGIRYGERYAYSPIRFELLLGQQLASHNNPVLQGVRASGYYGGINLHYESPVKYRLQAGGDISYVYHSAQQQINQQEIDMRLHTSEVRLWLGLHVNPHIKLYACASTISINGKQTISDTVFSQADFSNLHKKGYCGGVRYDLGDAGYIGLEGSGRHRQGGRIFFGRHFRM